MNAKKVYGAVGGEAAGSGFVGPGERVQIEDRDRVISLIVDAIGGVLYLMLAEALEEVFEGKRSRDGVARTVIMRLPELVWSFAKEACKELSKDKERLLAEGIEEFMRLYNTRVRRNAIINLDDMLEFADDMAIQLVDGNAWPVEDILINGVTENLKQAKKAVREAVKGYLKDHLCPA